MTGRSYLFEEEASVSFPDSFVLRDGLTIPPVGFGTWQIPDGAQAYRATTEALAVGYRHIDTARAYGNEASVGAAIADSPVSRDEIFITTKVPAEVKSAAEATLSFQLSREALGVDVIDLYLIHAPWPWDAPGSDHRAGNAEVWAVLEDLQRSGLVRSIGVSNFNVDDLIALAETAIVTPAVNQIRFHVGHIQQEVTIHCQGEGILVEGYSPLATGRILNDGAILTIAGRHERSAAQICLRYVLQKGILPLPKSTTPSWIAENLDLNFELDDDEVAQLDALRDPE
jgi:diketogulonate reductase-like aldo/keto reductase